MGYVYLIGSPNFGWYKIGKSITPDVRIKDIGILLPFRIKVLAVWKVENCSLVETLLHEKYAEFKINGEWFGFTKDKIKQIIFKEMPDECRLFPSPATSDSQWVSPTDHKFRKFSNAVKDTLMSKKDKTIANRPTKEAIAYNIARRKASKAAGLGRPQWEWPPKPETLEAMRGDGRPKE